MEIYVLMKMNRTVIAIHVIAHLAHWLTVSMSLAVLSAFSNFTFSRESETALCADDRVTSLHALTQSSPVPTL